MIVNQRKEWADGLANPLAAPYYQMRAAEETACSAVWNNGNDVRQLTVTFTDKGSEYYLPLEIKNVFITTSQRLFKTR